MESKENLIAYIEQKSGMNIPEWLREAIMECPTDPNQSETPTSCDHTADISKMLDSAYTEGYTAAESKYRKMWDEMQANIKEKAFGKHKGLIHTADIDAMPTIEERKTGKWIPVDSYSAFGGDEVMWEIHGNPIAFYYCSECKEHAYAGEDGESLLTTYCPNCGARLVQEGEDND